MPADKIHELLVRIMDVLGTRHSLEQVIRTLIDSLSIANYIDEDFFEILKESTKEEIAIELSDLSHDKDILTILKDDLNLKEYVNEILLEFSRRENRLEILVEEPSMQNFLEIILPKILPRGYELNMNCFIHPHQGKSDLQKSIPKKVRAYKYFPKKVKLIIVQDQDSNDCIKLKNELINLVENQNQNQPYLIRIACRELENWYLGDMLSIERVFTTFKASKYENKAKFRNPDIVTGSYELEKLIENFSKGVASKEIPKFMNIDQNNSPSFGHLISGVQNFLI